VRARPEPPQVTGRAQAPGNGPARRTRERLYRARPGGGRAVYGLWPRTTPSWPQRGTAPSADQVI